MSQQLHEEAIAKTGPAQGGTYQRLKVEAAVRRVADEVSDLLRYPPDSARAAFIRASFSGWARQKDEWKSDDPAVLNAALLGRPTCPTGSAG